MVIFVDSFNHFDQLFPKWDFPIGASILNDAAIARSGSRCLQISGAGGGGPQKNIGTGLQVVQYTQLIQGVALNFDAISSAADVIHFEAVGPGFQVANVIVIVNTDGSITVSRGAGDTVQTILGTSVTKPFVFNPTPTVSGVWNYIEVKVLISHTVGTVEVRFAPPGGPMSVILSLVGQNTTALQAVPYCNQVHLDGPGALNQHAYLADYYCLDWSTPPNVDYLGGVKIFRDMPFANGDIVTFQPLTTTNWEEVDKVPPPGDTSYNAGGLGDLDQYQHNVTNVPSNAQIKMVQHVMYARTDTGARAITSVVGGVVSPLTVYLSNGYYMFTYPYDKNPVNGLDWKFGDFPAQFGPKVVA